jgi:hypothetical protein
MGEIVSIRRLFQSKVLLFEREAQILTARQAVRKPAVALGRPRFASITRAEEAEAEHGPTKGDYRSHETALGGIPKDAAEVGDSDQSLPILTARGRHDIWEYRKHGVN